MINKKLVVVIAVLIVVAAVIIITTRIRRRANVYMPSYTIQKQQMQGSPPVQAGTTSANKERR